MAKRSPLALLLLVALFLLTGCYKVDAEVTFTPEDTASVEGLVAFPKKLPAAKYEAALKDLRKKLPKGTKLEDYKEKGLKGKSFVVKSMPAAKLFAADSGISYRHLGQVYTLKSTPGELSVSEESLRALFPEATTDPAWSFAVNFPVEITEATEGIEVEGSRAVIPQAVLFSGEPWKVEAGGSPAAEEEAPAPAQEEVQRERSPYPGYLFTGLIVVGLFLFVGGRYMNFPQKNGEPKAAKPKKAKKR